MANIKRSIWQALWFTKDGHLDLSWLLCFEIVLSGVFGFSWEMITGHRASLLGWTFLSTAFLATLIASVPLSKAKILADSKTIENLDSELAKIVVPKNSDSSVG